VNLVLFLHKNKSRLNPVVLIKEKFVFVLPSRDLIGYKIFPSLVVDQQNLTFHRVFPSQPLSGLELIRSDVNRSFSPASNRAYLWVLPGLLPAHHILLAATSRLEGQMHSQLHVS